VPGRRRWVAGALERPFGRGLNLQVTVDEVGRSWPRSGRQVGRCSCRPRRSGTAPATGRRGCASSSCRTRTATWCASRSAWASGRRSSDSPPSKPSAGGLVARDRGTRISRTDALTPTPSGPTQLGQALGVRAPAPGPEHERQSPPRSPDGGSCASGAHHRSPACSGRPPRPKHDGCSRRSSAGPRGPARRWTGDADRAGSAREAGAGRIGGPQGGRADGLLAACAHGRPRLVRSAARAPRTSYLFWTIND
jgi:hypothetical protein